MEAVQDVQQYQNRSNNSNGRLLSQEQRLILWSAGGVIFLTSPLTGTGVGSYAESFSKLSNAPASLAASRSQPHSEFVLMAVQGGGIALILYLTIFLFAVKPALTLTSAPAYGPSLVALLFFFYSVFNSAIWDLAEGHFFAIIIGMIIADDFKASSVNKKDF
ncbi:hypothetical protein EBR03_09175 [bacterium]|nr:hypothetical protein [bacterium]